MEETCNVNGWRKGKGKCCKMNGWMNEWWRKHVMWIDEGRKKGNAVEWMNEWQRECVVRMSEGRKEKKEGNTVEQISVID